MPLESRDTAHAATWLNASPVKRAKRRGLLRKRRRRAGNWGAPEAVPVLAALNDEEPPVRGHAVWAQVRIGTEGTRQALRGRAEEEADAWVREEVEVALGSSGNRPTRLLLGERARP